MTEQATKVLYILGSGRNGSTVLATILGSLDGVTTIGEAHWLWDRGLVEGRLCGCGRSVAECPYWSGLLAATDDLEGLGHRVAALRDRALSGVKPFRLAWSGWERAATSDQRELISIAGEVYGDAADRAGSSVIVDSSKRPTYGLLLRRSEQLDVYALHLVRDSRAVGFSWLRKKFNPDIPGGGYMRRHGSFKSAAGWFVWNLLSEVFWFQQRGRYLRVRYEDFVAAPEATLSQIADFAGFPMSEGIFLAADTVDVKESHTISGNPSRFASGPVTLRTDEEWKGAMRWRDKWLITLLTWPQLLRYGYPVRDRAPWWRDVPDSRE